MKEHDYLESHRRRRSLRRRLRWYAWVFGIGIFVLVGAVTFVRAPWFKVQSIEVTGLANDDATDALVREVTAQVEAGITLPFLSTDHFFAWPRALAFSTNEIQRIDIQKKFFERTIVIEAYPRIPFGIWCFSGGEGECVWVDEEEGVVMQEAAKPEGTLVTTIYDTRLEPPQPGEPVISSEYLARIKKIVTEIKASGISFSHFRIDEETYELEMSTVGGTPVRFSIRGNAIREAVAALKALSEKESLNAFASVDLTVENKVYAVRK